MKVKIKSKCYTGHTGNMFTGEEHDLEPRVAEKLIERGLAEAVSIAPSKAPKKVSKKAPKKTNRSVGLTTSDIEIVTPEDE